MTVNKSRTALALLAVVAGCAPDSSSEAPRLRLATTTSTRDSGLLEELLPHFQQQSGAAVDVIAVGTGKALRLGEAGDVDAVLVHDRAAEDQFLAAGHGIRRESVMVNSFEIVGPPADPAEIEGMSPVEALLAIAQRGAHFISRGDDSGTHRRELELWRRAGLRPQGPNYIESGQGMGATLVIADEMGAYALVDRATMLAFGDQSNLVSLVTGAPELENPYGVLVVNDKLHPGVNERLAHAFCDFLLSRETQQRIADFRIAGEPLFRPMHQARN